MFRVRISGLLPFMSSWRNWHTQPLQRRKAEGSSPSLDTMLLWRKADAPDLRPVECWCETSQEYHARLVKSANTLR